MSGIIGKITFDPREPPAVGTLEQMLDALAHCQDTARAYYQAPGSGLASCARTSARQRVSSGGDTLRACTFAALQSAASTPAMLKQRGRVGMYALRAVLARELPVAEIPAEYALLAPRRAAARTAASSLQTA